MKYLYSLILFCCLLSQLTGQVNNGIQPAALCIHAGFSDFNHTNSKKSFPEFNHLQTGIALSYLNGLSENIDLQVMGMGSLVDFTSKKSVDLGMKKNQLLLETDASVRAKLKSYPARFNPFFLLGVGASVYSVYYGIYIPMGIGLQIRINSKSFILLGVQYRMALTATQDNHFVYSIGLGGIIGKNKRVRKHYKTNTKIIEPLRPPSDIDGDGIVDSLDRCPIVPGVERYQGCPIPDTDGDGINDEEDSCITVPGILRYHGCPIPDRDKDNVNDEDDRCPDVPGLVSNHGCPLPIDTIKEQINLAAKNILFFTGSYQLAPSSFASLDDVVTILKSHPILKMDIEGHTDNVGKQEANQLLSEQRAKEVMDYFITRGISALRLHSSGFGQLRPIADNITAEGRTTNRRVELKLRKN